LNGESLGSFLAMTVSEILARPQLHKIKDTFTAEATPTDGGFGGLAVSVLASGSRVRGFEPGQSRWIFSV
jgi:hypothetical protein